MICFSILRMGWNPIGYTFQLVGINIWKKTSLLLLLTQWKLSAARKEPALPGCMNAVIFDITGLHCSVPCMVRHSSDSIWCFFWMRKPLWHFCSTAFASFTRGNKELKWWQRGTPSRQQARYHSGQIKKEKVGGGLMKCTNPMPSAQFLPNHTLLKAVLEQSEKLGGTPPLVLL